MLNLFRFTLLGFLLLQGYYALAQQSKSDSLWTIYKDTQQKDTNRLNAIEWIVRSYLERNADTAILYAQKQLFLAQQTKQAKYEANAYSYLGYVYYFEDNTSQSLEFFQKALKLYQIQGNKIRMSKCYAFIGLVYFKKSNYPQTLDYYFKSLKIEEELGNERGMALGYNNIGLVYDKQSKYDRALEYYFKALKINEKLNHKIGVANSLLNSGAIYDKQLKKEKALNNYLQALKIYQEEESEQDISFCLTCIGILYFDQFNYALALEYYNKALEINERLGNKKEMSTSFLNIGTLYNKTGNYPLASANFLKAKQLSTETDDLDNLRLSYEGLSRVYANTGNYKMAYENHLKFKWLTDSIFNIENSQQLSDIKINFEVDKKESELKAKAEAQQLISNEEKKRQQFIIYAVIAVLGIVMVFSFFLYQRFRLTNKQKLIIEQKNRETEAQNAIIEEHQKETIDSINYARRIQYALLANKDLLEKHLPQHFVLFSPKDIVSGDFYWAAEHNNKFYLAVCDSTGHGVPGAFMSLLNIGFLNEAIKEKDLSQPHEVLNFVRKRLIESIGNEGQQDGMDAILLCMERQADKEKGGTLLYAAANNMPLLVRNNQIIELSKDKMPVGKGEKTQSFSLFTVDVQKGDNLYMFTDGYADQFGGPNGKKFKYKQLETLLLKSATLVPEKQKQLVAAAFEDWKGDLEQVDDVCLIGIKM